VDHDRRVAVGVSAGGTRDRERVSAASSDQHPRLLARHRRDLFGETVQRFGHDDALRGRQLGFEEESPTFVGPTPREPSVFFDLFDLDTLGAA
jgi:hypothetical protein